MFFGYFYSPVLLLMFHIMFVCRMCGKNIGLWIISTLFHFFIELAYGRVSNFLSFVCSAQFLSTYCILLFNTRYIILCHKNSTQNFEIFVGYDILFLFRTKIKSSMLVYVCRYIVHVFMNVIVEKTDEI